MENNVIRYNGGLLDPFFDAFFGDDRQTQDYGALNMKSDIIEVGDNYEISIEMPGLEKKNISLALKDGYLTVKTKVNREDDVKDKKGTFLHRERFSGMSTRSYFVGDVTEQDIKASYKDGLLEITFPKAAVKKSEAASTISID